MLPKASGSFASAKNVCGHMWINCKRERNAFWGTAACGSNFRQSHSEFCSWVKHYNKPTLVVSELTYTFNLALTCTGSSGSVRYTNLEPGRYTLRVAAGESRAERGIERRNFEIPPDNTYCTTHLINEGVSVGFGGQVTVEFASVGPVEEFMCRLDSQEQFSCEY